MNVFTLPLIVVKSPFLEARQSLKSKSEHLTKLIIDTFNPSNSQVSGYCISVSKHSDDLKSQR